MIDGNPVYPDIDFQWRLAAETEATMLGLSPAYLMACRKAGLATGPAARPLPAAGDRRGGSPLPAEGFDWIYEQLGPDVLLNNGSGGTDVCTGIVQGSPMQPVYRGEIAGRCLAVDAAAFDIDGNEVDGRAGRARDPLADALDAGRLLERPRRPPLPRRLLRAVPGRLAPRRLDHVHRTRQLRDHRPLGRDAQPRRGAARDR